MVTLNAIGSSDGTPFTDGGPQENIVTGNNGANLLSGTSGNDAISGGNGQDVITGTLGNDFIDGGVGFDTLDYTNLGEAVTLRPAPVNADNNVDTQIVSIERVVGTAGQRNTIDGSLFRNSSNTSINVDLSNNSLIVNDLIFNSGLSRVLKIGNLDIEVENFLNVVGTDNRDTIVGDDARNRLIGRGGNDDITGGGGNDDLRGGAGKDRLNGTDSLLRGANERDALVGNGGADSFILGDEQGSFYTAAGDGDFAKIAVLNNVQDTIVLGRGETYRIEPSEGFDSRSPKFGLFVERENGQELIAQINDLEGVFARTGGIDTSSDDLTRQFILLQANLPAGSLELAPGESSGIFTGA